MHERFFYRQCTVDFRLHNVFRPLAWTMCYVDDLFLFVCMHVFFCLHPRFFFLCILVTIHYVAYASFFRWYACGFSYVCEYYFHMHMMCYFICIRVSFICQCFLLYTILLYFVCIHLFSCAYLFVCVCMLVFVRQHAMFFFICTIVSFI